MNQSITKLMNSLKSGVVEPIYLFQGNDKYLQKFLSEKIANTYFDSENHSWYRFIHWQRTYDRWSINVMGFWNPKKFQIYRNITENNLFAGKGIQLMAVLNH